MNARAALRVLLVEDNPADADVVQLFLDEEPDGSFELEWVSSLTEALARVGSNGIDVILLDLGLPESEGAETFDRVFAASADLPIVVMTGHDEQTLAFRVVQSGAQDYLIKGRFDREVLVRTLRYSFERHRAQAKVDAYHRRMVQSEKLASLGTLIAGIAHEIKSPLTYVSTNHYVMAKAVEAMTKLDDMPDDVAHGVERMRRALEANERGISRIDAIVRSLRTLGRPAGHEHNDLDLRAVVSDTVPILEPMRKHRDIHLAMEIPPEPVMVTGNATQLSQVLMNLLRNAYEATAPGGHVAVRLVAGEDGTLLEVSDDGPGIPERDQGRIFDPFFTRKDDGTGLGLAITAEIVEAHGAAIEYTPSASGSGARFMVALPATTNEPDATRADVNEAEAGMDAISPRRDD